MRKSPDAIKARRVTRAQRLRAEAACDQIDDLTGERLLQLYEPLPSGFDQLGDLPEPEQKLPYWVEI